MANIYPAVKFVEVKDVFFTVNLNIHKLHIGAVKPRGGIKRRSNYGGQNNVYARIRRGAQVSVNQLPMALGVHGYFVIIGNAIGIKPLGVFKRLLGQRVRRTSILKVVYEGVSATGSQQ